MFIQVYIDWVCVYYARKMQKYELMKEFLFCNMKLFLGLLKIDSADE